MKQERYEIRGMLTDTIKKIRVLKALTGLEIAAIITAAINDYYEKNKNKL